MALPNISNVWAILGILTLLAGSHIAVYLAGQTAEEKKHIEKEHSSLIEWVQEQKRITEGYKPIYEAIASHHDDKPVGGLIAGTLDDIKRLRNK